MRLINDYPQFAVYELPSGKGVLFVKNQKRGNNSALFDSTAKADGVALALMFGGSVSLTHRIKQPVESE